MFPLHSLLHLGADRGVAAGLVQITHACLVGQIDDRGDERHYEFVAFYFVSHGSELNLRYNQRRASLKRRCTVLTGRPIASAVSMSVRPMKYRSSTMEHQSGWLRSSSSSSRSTPIARSSWESCSCNSS